MLVSMRKLFREKGQGIVEYALLLAFVVAIAIFALQNGELGKAIKTNFSNTASQVTNFDANKATSSNP